jgi:cyclopropane-fatty-acyl-phospholipid synthase
MMSTQTPPWQPPQPQARFLDKLLEKGYLPEWMIRLGIQSLLRAKNKAETAPTQETRQEALMAFVNELKTMPIAIETEAANQQHYEVPSEFYQYALGPRLKYSCALWQDEWPVDGAHLGKAEAAMLALTCERADLQDGQAILELGCGWGSLSLWMAEKYPNATITGISNSASQREYIMGQARERGLNNLSIETHNVAHMERPMASYDRVVSVEMFEHMKNYERLLKNIAGWLKPEGKLFVHIFTHYCAAYHYEGADAADWMTRYFFAGGTMPAHHLLHYFQQDLALDACWVVNGQHYQKTARVWHQNMKVHRDKLMPLFREIYGKTGNPDEQATKWWVYWQVFFMACEELWGFQNGDVWQVSHYRFTTKSN